MPSRSSSGSARVTSPDPHSEALQLLAYEGLRTMKLEPPTIARLTRLLHAAVARFEAQVFETIHTALAPETRHALDLLSSTDSDGDDAAQLALFPLRSDLASLKDDAGAVKIATVLEELAKLTQLRTLNLPADLFRTVPAKLVTHYRQRAASEKPREVRRHPAAVRTTLLAALCWQRQREITDTLVELLLHVAHRIGVQAEDKVDRELLTYAKRVVGKSKLLYKLAKAAKQGPDDTVRNVIYAAVGECAAYANSVSPPQVERSESTSLGHQPYLRPKGTRDHRLAGTRGTTRRCRSRRYARPARYGKSWNA